METLVEEREGVRNSLAIIRKPFVTSADPASDKYPENMLIDNNPLREDMQEDDIIRQMFEYDSSETAATLTVIFYITGTLLLLSWLSSLFICQFLNVFMAKLS